MSTKGGNHSVLKNFFSFLLIWFLWEKKKSTMIIIKCNQFLTFAKFTFSITIKWSLWNISRKTVFVQFRAAFRIMFSKHVKNMYNVVYRVLQITYKMLYFRSINFAKYQFLHGFYESAIIHLSLNLNKKSAVVNCNFYSFVTKLL